MVPYPTSPYISLHSNTFPYIVLHLPTPDYMCTQSGVMYLFSYPCIQCAVMWDTVGKKIPLATLWLGVAKGIQCADTVRLGRMMCALPYIIGQPRTHAVM